MAGSTRSVYLRVDEQTVLDLWLAQLSHAFGRNTVRLVGSVLERPDHRDVDVRLVLNDETVASIPMSIRVLNMLLSRWGQQQTGLPIDCQVQPESEAAKYEHRPFRIRPGSSTLTIPATEQ